MNYYLQALKNYADFKGRAKRPEYWYFVLFNLLIIIAILVLANFVHVLGLLYPIYSLAVLIPSLAVTVRRLNDIGKAWYWIFIALVPLVGALILLYFMVQPSKGGK